MRHIVFKTDELIVFHSGAVDPSKSSIRVSSSVLVMKESEDRLISFDERDKYDNAVTSTQDTLKKYAFFITEVKLVMFRLCFVRVF